MWHMYGVYVQMHVHLVLDIGISECSGSHCRWSLIVRRRRRSMSSTSAQLLLPVVRSALFGAHFGILMLDYGICMNLLNMCWSHIFPVTPSPIGLQMANCLAAPVSSYGSSPPRRRDLQLPGSVLRRWAALGWAHGRTIKNHKTWV